MALERFSPHFEKPWMGFEERWPHPAYELVYKLPDDELQDFSFFFQSHDAGIDDDLISRLQLAIDQWRETYRAGGFLHHEDQGDSIRITDRRHPGQEREYTLTDPLQMSALRAMRVPQTRSSLLRTLEQQQDCTDEDVENTVGALQELGLMFHDDRHFVRLSTPPIPFRQALQ